MLNGLTNRVIGGLTSYGVPRGAAPFNPRSLFMHGEQGAWYDPSDFSTMFQDAAGTTPVTAVEQYVGLMLDKSKGLALGPELVTNGTFDTSLTGWDSSSSGTPASVVWSAGSALFTSYNSSTQTAWLTQAMSVSAGKTYKITFTSSAGLYVYAGGSFLTSAVGGDNTLFYTATSSSVTLGFRSLGATTRTLDNISVREIAGNHAYQTTSASRPLLSARYNLLTKTEQFDDGYWVKLKSGGGSTPDVVPNDALSPIGTQTADKVTFSAPVSGDQSTLASTAFSATVGVSYASALWVKAAVAGDIGKILIWRHVGSGSYGTITLTSSWQEVNRSETAALTSCTYDIGLRPSVGGSSGTVSAHFWGASLVHANQALLPYQRVNTATDYDTVGFNPYIKFDGTDDYLVTNSIDFTATDKMTVWAGVRKLSDAATGAIVELSVDYTMNNGSFVVLGTQSAMSPVNTGYGYRSKGTAVSSVNNTTVLAPSTNVLACISSISGDTCKLRINGADAAASSQDQGTGNYGNYSLYIGRRGGTTLPFNGQIYSLIIRGAQSTDAQISNTEKYTNDKTGAYA